MRYKIRGLEIRSENAAKPATSAGTWMLRWIDALEEDHNGLDLGCGKLRYTLPLSKRIATVTAVDSEHQVDREQTLFGFKTSVRTYAQENLSNVRVYSLKEREWRKEKYSLVLCSNVLSAIPSRKVRLEVVATAYARLRRGGKFLLTTQFKNSHYSKLRSSVRTSPYCDGMLIRTGAGAAFYGFLDADALSRLCRSVGFKIVQRGHAKELAFVLASR